MNFSCSGLRGKSRSGVPRTPAMGSPKGETKFCSSPRSSNTPSVVSVSGDLEISLLGTAVREQPTHPKAESIRPARRPLRQGIYQEPPSTTKWAFRSIAEVEESAFGVANSSPMDSTSIRLPSAPKSTRYCFTLEALRSPRDLL